MIPKVINTREELVNKLLNRPYAIFMDKRDMEIWLRGEMTDEELAERFRINNHIREIIPPSIAVEFARSVNYKRGTVDGKV